MDRFVVWPWRRHRRCTALGKTYNLIDLLHSDNVQDCRVWVQASLVDTRDLVDTSDPLQIHRPFLADRKSPARMG